MIGVDRLDYSKGITLRLEAYERFLAAHPEWHGKITYLQITPKSRSTIREYAQEIWNVPVRGPVPMGVPEPGAQRGALS